jgi:hypothetical protein
MVQVVARIAIWVLVFGIGYLLLGPQLFDSTPSSDPVGRPASTLMLPPAKPAELVDYERRIASGQLNPDELPRYQALARDYQAGFWAGSEESVEQALAEIPTDRMAHLLSILADRGLTRDEQSVFITLVKRDAPSFLADRQ